MSYINKVVLPNSTEYDVNDKASTSAIGLVKPDDETLKVDSSGSLSVNEFIGTRSQVTAAITAGTIEDGANVYITDDTSESGGGGHTILNSSGTEMTQEDNLQFVNLNVTDDSTNSKTVVTAPVATTSAVGMSMPDDSTLKVDSNGEMSVNEFYGTTAQVNSAITAGTIPENANVYISDDSGSEMTSGHTIMNSSGTEMTQEQGLQFMNLNVVNDSTNNKTVVTAPIATENLLGLIKPDGTTVTIDANGVISAAVVAPIPNDAEEGVTFVTSAVTAVDANEEMIIQ